MLKTRSPYCWEFREEAVRLARTSGGPTWLAAFAGGLAREGLVTAERQELWLEQENRVRAFRRASRGGVGNVLCSGWSGKSQADDGTVSGRRSAPCG